MNPRVRARARRSVRECERAGERTRSCACEAAIVHASCSAEKLAGGCANSSDRANINCASAQHSSPLVSASFSICACACVVRRRLALYDPLRVVTTNAQLRTRRAAENAS
eukprot:5446433-Pleurochrysis_carterae.AAC.1